jgi:dihydroneopterin aldolase
VKIDESYVFLRNVRFHAFHGVLPQERQVGGEFLLSLRVGYPLAKAMESDEVGDTLNYATLFDLVKQEMDIPSQLLEHVAGRIAKAIVTVFPEVTSIDLELTKQNPPMGADSDGAGVMIKFKKLKD